MNWKRLLVIGMIVVVAGAAALLWSRYFGSSPAAPVTHTTEQKSSKELLLLLETLRGLKFDTSFFNDQLYKSLQDFTPDIPTPQVQGKISPFVTPESGF